MSVSAVKMVFHMTACQKTPDGFQEKQGEGKKLLQKQRRHKVRKKKSLRTNKKEKIKERKIN